VKKLRLLITFNALLLFLYSFLGVASSTLGQESKSLAGNLLTVKSKPEGAIVQLIGEYEFVGRTPFILPYPLFGKYQVKASKSGFEGINTAIHLSGEVGYTFNLYLKPKTKLKALSRSLAFPGWGQYYSGRKFTGSIFLGATASALVVFAKNEQRYRNAQTDYENAASLYNLPDASFEERAQLDMQVQSALKNLDDRKIARNISLYVAGGIWLLNVLESALFFPDYAKKINVFQKMSLNVMPDKSGLRLGMQYHIN